MRPGLLGFYTSEGVHVMSDVKNRLLELHLTRNALMRVKVHT